MKTESAFWGFMTMAVIALVTGHAFMCLCSFVLAIVVYCSGDRK